MSSVAVFRSVVDCRPLAWCTMVSKVWFDDSGRGVVVVPVSCALQTVQWRILWQHHSQKSDHPSFNTIMHHHGLPRPTTAYPAHLHSRPLLAITHWALPSETPSPSMPMTPSTLQPLLIGCMYCRHFTTRHLTMSSSTIRFCSKYSW